MYFIKDITLLTFVLFVVGCGPPEPEYSPSQTVSSPEVEGRSVFGVSVSGLGDVNGDGVQDVLVGASGESVGGTLNAGRAYLISGEDGGVVETLSSPNFADGGKFGDPVRGIGDVNGDGTPDALVTAGFETVDGATAAGRVYMYSGADGSLIRALHSPNVEERGDFGRTLAGVGDVDKDGVEDFIVGAPYEDSVHRNAGRAYIFSGADGSLIQTSVSPNAQILGLFGSAVSGVGDVNKDGIPDVMVGAFETVRGDDDAGLAYLFSGADGAHLRTFASPNSQEEGSFGSSVEGLADLNGDGVEEVIIGAPHETVNGSTSGRSYIYSGSDGDLLQTITSPNSSSDGWFGQSVTGVGDVNGDDIADVFVSAPFENVGGSGAGRVYLFSGADASLLRTYFSPNLEEGSGGFGSDIDAVESSREEGNRLIVGAKDEVVSDSSYAGRAYLYELKED